MAYFCLLKDRQFVTMLMITHFFLVSFNNVNENLRWDFSILEKWYFDNFFVLNPDKCYFMTLGKGKQVQDFQLENEQIQTRRKNSWIYY